MSDHGLATLDVMLIRSTIAAMIHDVDLLELESAQRLFAPQVAVDYTSLWGGAAAPMTPLALVSSWGELLPGFDATWHELGDIAVQVRGDRADAACDVAARHWIGREVWLPKGRYEFGLVRMRGAWRIDGMRLLLAEEIGARALVERARNRSRGQGRRPAID